MAQGVTAVPTAARGSGLPAGWWPSDVVLTAYLAATAALVGAYWLKMPHAPALLAAHLGGIGLAAYAIRAERTRPNVLFWFRYWYPLPYIVACYKETSVLIPAVRGLDYDRQLADLDYALWGAHPTVWLERIQFPALTEFLQIVYTLFIPMVLLTALLAWLRRRSDYPYVAFLISAGFLISYVGYVLVPARGPRFLLAALQNTPVSGLWLTGALRGGLDTLESAHWDCFPSGHTELILVCWWITRRISQNLFRTFFVYSVFMIFATVYLRYHYSIDIAAGAATAAGLLVLGPRVHEWMRQRIAGF